MTYIIHHQLVDDQDIKFPSVSRPGTHYYYNMTPQMKCEDFLPWFALVSRGDLVGTGFQMFGKLTKPPAKLTDWFERPPSPKKSVDVSKK